MEGKTNNLVAKHARKYNKAAVHKDRKKALKKGDRKHKGSYESVEEVLKVSDGASAWIKDFQSSDAPQFKGKSMDKRKEMALAAYLDAKKGSKEESVEEWSCNTTEKTRRVKGGDKRKKYMKEKQVNEKKGLWDRIHAKRKRGEKPAKPGDKDYPKTLDVGEDLKQARKNVGSDSCWDGYKATGTKMKGGKEVPDCKKEAALPPHLQKILDKKGNVDPKKVAKHVYGRKSKSNVTDVTPKGYGPKESAQDRLDRMAAKHGLGKPNKAADDYLAKMMKKYGAKDMADLKKKMGMKEDVDKAQLKLKHAKEKESLKSKHAREREQSQSTNEYKYQLDCKDHLEELTQRELDMMAARKQKNLVKRGKAKPEPKKPASAGRTQNVGRAGGEDDSSLVMQLRKAQDLKGNHDIQFKGGKTKLPKQMIDKLLNTYDKLSKPADKKKFETLVTHELRKKEGIATQKSKTAADKAMDKFNRTRNKGLPAPRGKQSGPSARDLRDIERGK